MKLSKKKRRRRTTEEKTISLVCAVAAEQTIRTTKQSLWGCFPSTREEEKCILSSSLTVHKRLFCCCNIAFDTERAFYLRGRLPSETVAQRWAAQWKQIYHCSRAILCFTLKVAVTNALTKRRARQKTCLQHPRSNKRSTKVSFSRSLCIHVNSKSASRL